MSKQPMIANMGKTKINTLLNIYSDSYLDPLGTRLIILEKFSSNTKWSITKEVTMTIEKRAMSPPDKNFDKS
jgi:hypothetical protein